MKLLLFTESNEAQEDFLQFSFHFLSISGFNIKTALNHYADYVIIVIKGRRAKVLIEFW